MSVHYTLLQNLPVTSSVSQHLFMVYGTVAYLSAHDWHHIQFPFLAEYSQTFLKVVSAVRHQRQIYCLLPLRASMWHFVYCGFIFYACFLHSSQFVLSKLYGRAHYLRSVHLWCSFMCITSLCIRNVKCCCDISQLTVNPDWHMFIWSCMTRQNSAL